MDNHPTTVSPELPFVSHDGITTLLDTLPIMEFSRRVRFSSDVERGVPDLYCRQANSSELGMRPLMERVLSRREILKA